MATARVTTRETQARLGGRREHLGRDGPQATPDRSRKDKAWVGQ